MKKLFITQFLRKTGSKKDELRDELIGLLLNEHLSESVSVCVCMGGISAVQKLITLMKHHFM